MKIGMVCYPSLGGSGTVAAELGKQLAQRGHELHFISYDLPFRLRGRRNRIYFHAVSVPSYPLFQHQPYVLALANRIADIARSQQLDLVHVHYAIPHAAAAYLARQVLGPPGFGLVTTLHGTDITLVGSDPSFAAMTAFTIDQSDAVTAVSRSLAEATQALLRTSKEVRVIPNLIDLREYRPLPRGGAGERPDGRKEAVLLHASNFRPLKRAERCVEILRRVLPHHPARLLLAGDGPGLARVLQAAEAAGVADHVQQLGVMDEIAPAVAAADVVLLPSDQESFGLVALEAMACGVPVVASDVGGLPEVVSHGETGFLYRPDDAAGMAEGVLALLAQPDLRRRFGEAGRRKAEAEFAPERIVPMYEALYERVLTGCPAPS